MLKRRVSQVETILRRRQAVHQAAAREASAQVAALRALLAQLREADPFSRLQDTAYLRAFWPWLLAGAGRWPAWAVEYALVVGGLPAASGRLARRSSPTSRQPLRSAADVVRLLEEQVETLRVDATITPLEQARAIGYLAGVARKAIETGNLAARLEMLERVLKQRSGGATP
jgi:hypothetical protein